MRKQEAGSVRKSRGRWIYIPQGNIFGSLCRGSFMSIEVRVSTSVSPYVLFEHILCIERYYCELSFCVFYALSVSSAYSLSWVLSSPLNLFFLSISSVP